MENASQYLRNSDAVRIVNFLNANWNTIIKKHEGAVHDAQTRCTKGNDARNAVATTSWQTQTSAHESLFDNHPCFR
jgi:hypothetical protein